MNLNLLIMNDQESDVARGIDALLALASKTARDAGWYCNPETGEPIQRNFGEVVALILVNATAQAEANIKLAKSLTPELVQYAMMSKLAPNIQVMMIPAGQQFIMSPEMIRPTTAARQ